MNTFEIVLKYNIGICRYNNSIFPLSVVCHLYLLISFLYYIYAKLYPNSAHFELPHNCHIIATGSQH